MPTDLPKRDNSWIAARRNKRNEVAAVLSIPALLVLLLGAFPTALVLPAFSIATVSWGLLVALRLYLWPQASLAARERAQVLAGMLLLFGFGASMMTNVGDALSAFAELERSYAAAK